MWQPSTGQWVVIGITALIATAIGLAASSLLIMIALIALDAGLIVWWMEGRRRRRVVTNGSHAEAAPATPAPRKFTRQGVLYVFGALLFGMVTATAQGFAGAEWVGATTSGPLVGMIAGFIRSRFGATSIPRWMFWFSVVSLIIAVLSRR